MNRAPVVTVGIVGVSGYSGMELARLVAGHPGMALAVAVSDKWAGSPLGAHLPLPSPTAGLVVKPQKEALQPGALAGLGIVFLCTPAEASLALAPVALEAGTRVVDLPGACYTMPEAGASGDIRAARLVSNPGCYATASTLAALALLRGGVIERDGIVVDAKSGTTGAGRKSTEDMSFSELDGDFRAYRVLRHQHTPEIERALGLAGQGPLKLTFTPHLLPTRRGILATVYGRLKSGKGAADAIAAVDAFAEGKPFIRTAKPDAVRLHPVLGTNRVLLGADADPERGMAIAFASLDNLVKGAAGQAVQNANLMFGFDETTGLDGL